jgi:hypothetical protein
MGSGEWGVGIGKLLIKIKILCPYFDIEWGLRRTVYSVNQKTACSLFKTSFPIVLSLKR